MKEATFGATLYSALPSN